MTPDLLVLYEDENWRKLWPLSATRPVSDLRLGVRCLWEKTRDIWKPLAIAVESSTDKSRAPVIEAFAARRGLSVEAESEQARGSILWWNGAAIPLGAPPDAGPTLSEGVRLVDSEGFVVGVWHRADVSSARAMAFTEANAPLPAEWRELPVEVLWVRQLWDLLKLLELEIVRDVDALGDPGATPTLPHVHLLGTRVSVARDVRVDPGCVLDARHGPIVIAEGASLAPFTHLEGPAIVGEQTQLPGGRGGRSDDLPRLRQQAPPGLSRPRRRGGVGESRRPHHEQRSQEHLRFRARVGGRHRAGQRRVQGRLFPGRSRQDGHRHSHRYRLGDRSWIESRRRRTLHAQAHARLVLVGRRALRVPRVG